MKNRLSLTNIFAQFNFKPVSIWLLIVSIIIAELITIFLSPIIGIGCYSLLLIFFTVQPFFNTEDTSRELLLGMSLIPLTRIITVSLPLTKIPQIFWFPLIYIPLLAAAIIVMQVTGLKPKKVGLVTGNIPTQLLFGVVTGILIGVVEYLILKPAPMVVELSIKEIWLPALILVTTTGLVEELMFRGVLQSLTLPAMGISGLLYVNIIFGIMHLGFYSIADIFFVFLAGLLFSIFVKKTGSLFGVILSHGIANVILFTIAPFLLN